MARITVTYLRHSNRYGISLITIEIPFKVLKDIHYKTDIQSKMTKYHFTFDLIENSRDGLPIRDRFGGGYNRRRQCHQADKQRHDDKTKE